MFSTKTDNHSCMVNNKTVLSVFLFLLFVSASGQKYTRPLNIGDTLPSIVINKLINSNKPSLQTTDLRGKAVLIDFWTTWCSPCIAAFPKLDSLQSKLKDKLQIIHVTYEDSSKVTSFLKKIKSLRNLTPLTVSNDTILNKLFPHNVFPHYVWVDPDGIVKAFTEERDVSYNNLLNLSTKKSIQAHTKVDDSYTVLYENGAFTPGVTIKDSTSTTFKKLDEDIVHSRSILTKWANGLWPGTRKGKNIVTARNLTVSWLYRVCLYKDAFGLAPIIEIPDTTLYKSITGLRPDGSRFFEPGQEALDWMKKNCYSYEIKVDDLMSDLKYDMMLDELNRYFGKLYNIEGILEMREGNYLALTIQDSSKLENLKHLSLNTNDPDKLSVVVKNGSIQGIISQLFVPLQRFHPILDETDIKSKINISFTTNLTDLEAVNAELRKYGLAFINKRKSFPTAIIRNKKTIVTDQALLQK